MAAAKVKTLAEQKQDLIARSDLYRRAMAADLQQIETSLGWLPKTFSLIKAASPLLIVSSPLIAWLLRGRRKAKLGKNGETSKDKVGVLARIWGAIRFAQQVVPFVHGFVQAWPKTKSRRARETEPTESGYRTRE
jgi:hypothetical protein